MIDATSMPWRDSRQANPACTCSGGIRDVRRALQQTPQDAANILDQAERLEDAYWNSSVCPKSCYRSTQQVRGLLDCIDRLLDLIDSTWETTQSGLRYRGATSCDSLTSLDSSFLGASRPLQHHLIGGTDLSQVGLGSMGSSHSSTACINQLVLDESERNLLLRELLRTATASINKVLQHSTNLTTLAASSPENYTSMYASPGLHDVVELCGRQLDRTYLYLAKFKCDNSARLV